MLHMQNVFSLFLDLTQKKLLIILYNKIPLKNKYAKRMSMNKTAKT